MQEFSSGGIQVRLKYKKKALTTIFSPQHILQKSKGYFQRKLSFSKVPEEVQHFPGGGGGGGGGVSNFFQRGGGGRV